MFFDSKWKSIKIFSNHKVSRLHQSEYQDHQRFDYGVAFSAFFKVDTTFVCFFFHLNSSLFRMTSQKPLKHLIRDQTHSNEYRTFLADTNPMWAWQYNLYISLCIYIANNFICFHVKILSALTWHLRTPAKCH